MAETLKASDARIPPATYRQVSEHRRRIRIERRSSPDVYLVSEEDFRLLEALEDRIDIEEAEAALAHHKTSGDRTYTLDEVAAELGD